MDDLNPPIIRQERVVNAVALEQRLAQWPSLEVRNHSADFGAKGSLSAVRRQLVDVPLGVSGAALGDVFADFDQVVLSPLGVFAFHTSC